MNDAHHKGVSRREVLALAAVAALAANNTATAAEATPAGKRSRPADRNSGIPEVTAVISTSLGRVQGLVVNKVHAFKGIRYGAAPIGNLRWLPPQAPEPWSTILDCSDY